MDIDSMSLADLFAAADEIGAKYADEDGTLGELFAEADRVGDKYLTVEEIGERTARFTEEFGAPCEWE